MVRLGVPPRSSWSWTFAAYSVAVAASSAAWLSSAAPSAMATETTAATRRPRLVTKVIWLCIPAALITSASSARSSRTLISSAAAVSIHRWYPVSTGVHEASRPETPGAAQGRQSPLEFPRYAAAGPVWHLDLDLLVSKSNGRSAGYFGRQVITMLAVNITASMNGRLDGRDGS